MPKKPLIKPESLAIIACPITKSDLTIEVDGTLRSENGINSYPVKNDVSNFLSSKSWESADASHITNLIKIARADGYQKAIETMKDAHYVTDSSRAAYLDLLPLNKDSQVLEIGASIGQHTKLIGAKTKHVEALEIIPEQALFNKICCDQEGLSNVNVSIGGENSQLPYKDEVFDVVIMNYVLEWSAARSSLSPRDAHELLISECRRVLKPGGVFFLSTKNRFNLRLLKGGVDEHVEFRFGNALPRWLIKILSKRYPSSEILGYLHSFGALHGIFKTVGFKAIKPLLVLPDARYPRVYTTFSDEDLAKLRADESLLSFSRLVRILLKYIPSKAIKWVAPSLVFIAEK